MSDRKSLSDKITSTSQGMKRWQQERVIFEITERICELMREQQVTRSELATRLGTSRAHITQLLDGKANMTIRKISDVFTALNRQFSPRDTEITTENDADRPPSGTMTPELAMGVAAFGANRLPSRPGKPKRSGTQAIESKPQS